ncbi:hypothetical protein FB45DRAFT_320030 [Roridomyces roridus]|uniref:Uncharacterized protein n=1 Tax=Roridomyces roridus TaxID=1738132 RepID=A0AAD7B621_9AGAR|nr:hypothetical protein FB45DRAFT_320030 [Roridomyces roridus]
MEHSPKLAGIVKTLCITGIRPVYLEHLQRLAHHTFRQLVNLRLEGYCKDPATSPAMSATIQRFLRFQSLTVAQIKVAFHTWDDFARIWNGCSPNIRHLTYSTWNLGKVEPTGNSVLLENKHAIKLESFASDDAADCILSWLQDARCPFDVTGLKAHKQGIRQDHFDYDPLVGSLKTIRVLWITNWGEQHNLSRFSQVSQLNIDLIHTDAQLEFHLFNSTPEKKALIRAIRLRIPSRTPGFSGGVHVYLVQLLPRLQSNFFNLRAVHISLHRPGGHGADFDYLNAQLGEYRRLLGPRIDLCLNLDDVRAFDQ